MWGAAEGGADGDGSSPRSGRSAPTPSTACSARIRARSTASPASASPSGRRTHAGCAAEHVHTHAGIIRQCRQPGDAAGMACLGQGVFNEGAVRLLGFRNTQRTLRDHFNRQRREDRRDLAQLARIVGSDDEFVHRGPFQPSAARCAAISCVMPLCARSSMACISARLNGAPSAVPCTSMMPPASVITTFMSVSQSESSA